MYSCRVVFCMRTSSLNSAHYLMYLGMGYVFLKEEHLFLILTKLPQGQEVGNSGRKQQTVEIIQSTDDDARTKW